MAALLTAAAVSIAFALGSCYGLNLTRLRRLARPIQHRKGTHR